MTVTALSQAWLARLVEACRDLPVLPGATARLGWRISGGPVGSAAFVLGFVDGRLSEATIGGDDGVDCTVQAAYDDFVAMQRGQLDTDVGYMQGRVKVTGPVSGLFAVLPVVLSDPWRAALDEVSVDTAF